MAGSAGGRDNKVPHRFWASTQVPEWVTHGAGLAWPVDHYFDEGPRVTDWLAKGVRKEHRMIGTYLNLLIDAGFTVSRVQDWGPSLAQVAARPDWALERERPLFLFIAACR